MSWPDTTGSAATPAVRRPRDVVLALATAAGFFALALTAGWPGPAIDDLMFTGAAFSLARGHGLQNPWLFAQFGPGDFLHYTPFYFYLLGGWLKIVGAHTLALLAFQNFNYLLAGAALSGLLHRRGFLPRPMWLWPTFFAAALLTTLGRMGLRPEACGLAALFSGLWLCDGDGLSRRCAGWMCIGGALAIAPHTLSFACAGVVVITLFPAAPVVPPLWRDGRPLFAAALLLSGLLIWAVGGRLVELLHNLHEHASRTSLPIGAALKLSLKSFWGANALAPLPLVELGSAAVLAWTLGSPTSHDPRSHPRALGAAGVVSIALAIGVSMILDVARVEVWQAASLLLAVGAGAVLLARHRRFLGGAILIALLGALGWNSRHRLADFWAPSEPTPVACANARLAAAVPGRDYLIDAWAARYVFDYDLPPGAVDWSFGRHFPAMWPLHLHDRPADEVWIVTGRSLWMIAPADAPALRTGLSLFGRSLQYRPGANEIFVIADATPHP